MSNSTLWSPCMLRMVSLFLFFLSYSLPVLAIDSAHDYALNELIKAGWRIDAAKAVVALNKTWFTNLQKKHENDFIHQINLLKQLNHSIIVNRFLRQHPETAGLLALSNNPILLVKILKKPACYNALSSFYILSPKRSEIQLLNQALQKHRDLMCKLALRGLLGSEKAFIFPRQTQGAKEYDAWLEKVFDKYLQRSDEELAEIVAFLIEKGQYIRKRLDKEHDFYKRFRKELWPALMRVVDKNGAFWWLANDPHIWDLLALTEGEMLLKKWGLGPISLLFGDGSYQNDMRPIIIKILLQGDNNTVEALFRYKDEPLFRNLMRRPLSASIQAAMANQLVNLCPNYPEQACPELPYHLRYLASIGDNGALAEEVNECPKGPVTWIPFHGSYYAIKKMTEGREITNDDMLKMGLDALSLVPAALFAKPFSGVAQPLTRDIILKLNLMGIEGLNLTPYRYHLVKPLSKFFILTGSHTSRILTEQVLTQETIKEITMKPDNKKIFRPFEEQIVKPQQATKQVKTRETAQMVLPTQTTRFTNRKKALAWQQKISAWWLMNAAAEP